MPLTSRQNCIRDEDGFALEDYPSGAESAESELKPGDPSNVEISLAIER